MANLSRLLLSVAMLGAAVPAFAQGAAPAVRHHHPARVHRVATAHDVGAAAKPTPVPSAVAPAAPKVD